MANQKNLEMAQAPNFNANASLFRGAQQNTMYSESVRNFQATSKSMMEANSSYGFSGESFNHRMSIGTFNRQAFGAQQTAALYDDMALPDAFLEEYYSQVLSCSCSFARTYK